MQAAGAALLEALSTDDWAQGVSTLAAQVAEAGPSHRAHLEAVRRLPMQPKRSAVLRSHAAAALLVTVLPPTGVPPVRAHPPP